MEWKEGDGILITRGDFKDLGATITAVYSDGVYCRIDGTETVIFIYYGNFKRWSSY